MSTPYTPVNLRVGSHSSYYSCVDPPGQLPSRSQGYRICWQARETGGEQKRRAYITDTTLSKSRLNSMLKQIRYVLQFENGAQVTVKRSQCRPVQ